MSKATLSYRQKVLLGNYLHNHFQTNETGEAVQYSITSIADMLAELNCDVRPDECQFNDNHIHHARVELFGKLAKNKKSSEYVDLLIRLSHIEDRLIALEGKK